MDCQENRRRALKNYFTLSRLLRFQKKITQIFRDFLTFSEISGKRCFLIPPIMERLSRFQTYWK